ncbi:MAG: hypothetical protein JO091_08030 [Acidobacteriaceae bacterium]|nr:hypothetical protein [Acidobacteriaceae bacterium]
MLQIPPKLNRFRLPNRSRRQLPFPATPSLRIAQLGDPAIHFEAVQVFPCARWNHLQWFRPSVLVGSICDLQRLAELSQRRSLDLSSVDHAIFAVTRCGEQPVTDIARVVLWQAFGVPVYELFVSPQGALLASECEAHEGWHVEQSAKFLSINGELLVDVPGRPATPTGLSGVLETDACPCGRPGTRLMNVEPLALIRVRRALAATA